MAVITLPDVDELLDVTSSVDESVSIDLIKRWRDELAHVAVLLSYARNVLSVDVGVLESIVNDPASDLQAVVKDLPRIMAVASVGGGWSLSPDSTATMDSAGRALEGEADELLSSHSEIASLDFHSNQAVSAALNELSTQLGLVDQRRDLVEKRIRQVRTVLVQKYKSGEADPDDWLR